MHFENLQLNPKLLTAVSEQGYTESTAIQAQAIPHVLAGRDLLGCAQTGTGKTAAFALPILQRLMESSAASPGATPSTPAALRPGRPPRALVLVPTRELAAQVADSFKTYGRHTGLRCAVVFGGVNQSNQVRALRAGVDILVAAPGRLMDLMGQGLVSLRFIEVFVLDEADRMLDMGFIQPIRDIVAKLPAVRQNLMFSATMPDNIRSLANRILKNPASVAVAPVASTVEAIEQDVYFVDQNAKADLLLDVLRAPEASRVLVFTRTKHGANRLTTRLERANVQVAVIHGNKSQNARQRALDDFKRGSVHVLVATDVAARGIDVDAVSHVVNFDLPNEPESYVHRIGRTGRAGASGIAVSFCDRSERGFLRDIERLIRRQLRVVTRPTSAGRPQETPRRAMDDRDRRPQGNAAPRPSGHAPRPQGGAESRPQGHDLHARTDGHDSRPREGGHGYEAKRPAARRPGGRSLGGQPRRYVGRGR